VSYYHQLHTQRVPLTLGQRWSLDNIIHRWHILEWMNKNYPEAEAQAPPPPPPVEDVGFAFPSSQMMRQMGSSDHFEQPPVR
jgi:hypothetical protein